MTVRRTGRSVQRLSTSFMYAFQQKTAAASECSRMYRFFSADSSTLIGTTAMPNIQAALDRAREVYATMAPAIAS